MIPLSEPALGPEEEAAVLAVLRSGLIGGNGRTCKEVERSLRDLLGCEFALLTTSCTHALELCLLAMDIGPGDEVVLPSFNFSSMAAAIVRQGARPVFAELDPSTLNIDPADVERRITGRTRAIMAIHYAGESCDMPALLEVSTRAGIPLIEDAAHAVGATSNGRNLGSLGYAGLLSFHVTKNLTAGEAGALLTSDEKLARRAEIIREKGTNRAQFLRGEVDKYTWMDIGSSYVLSDLLAAVLLAQLRRLEEITERRRRISERYFEAFAPLADAGRCRLLRRDAHSKANGHLFVLLVNPAERDDVLEKLRARGVGATFHYVPLHSSPFGQSLGYRRGDFPLTELASDSLVRLPLYAGMTDEQVEYVIASVEETLSGAVPAYSGLEIGA